MGERPQRIEWLDAARGIGILLVVIGHVERGLYAAQFPMGRPWQWADFALYSFHMPLFFLLAGLNVPRSLAHGSADFLRTKLWTIAWPYLLWSLVQGSLLVAVSPWTNAGATPAELARILWQPMAQFWFLYVLFAYQIVALATGGRPAPLIPLAILALLLGSRFDANSLPERLFHFLPFFTAGMLLSRPLLAMHRPSLAAPFVAVPLFALSAWAGGRIAFPFHDSLLLLPAAVAGTGMALLLAQRLGGSLLAAAQSLGRASMAIFVLHIIAGAGARIALVRLGLPRDPLLYLALCTAAGLLVPLLADRMIGRLGLRVWLGLGAPPRPPPAPGAG